MNKILQNFKSSTRENNFLHFKSLKRDKLPVESLDTINTIYT